MKKNLHLVKCIYTVLLLWSCIPLKALDYYWVGGTGNWSQYATHWATTSGGSTFQAQVPQSVDNVYFDANSFTAAGQSVNIDQTIVNCNNMDWTGATHNPSLSGPGVNTLYIYGSLTFVAGMSNLFYGYVYFQSATTGQTINCASQIFNSYISFNSTTGGWTLLDSLTVRNSLGQANISLVNGTLNTNGQNVTSAGWAIGNYSTAPTLILGSSLITVTGSMNNWNIGNSGLNLTAGTSTINMIGGGQFTGGRNTYYNVNFTTGGGAAINDVNTFNNVELDGGGYVSGSTFNNLTLTGANTYVLSGTATVNGLFTANGTCSGLISIQGGTVKQISGSVSVSYVFLQNVKASGAASFVANNSVDGGGNTGWTINSLPARNLHWIGNTGNWSDGSHWSLSSGGTASGCPPTPIDNVFFDANSFSLTGQTVTIDVNPAYCNNMDWTGATNNPILAGQNYYYLYLFGSLTLVADLTDNFNGYFFMVSPSAGNTVTTASVHVQNIYFNRIGGTWTLQDSLTAQALGLGGGTLISNNQNIHLVSFNGGGFGGYDGSQGGGTFDMGSSTITVSSYTGWYVYTGTSVNAGTSQIICTSNNNPSYFQGNGLTYYNVAFIGANAATQIDANIFNNVFIAGSAQLQTSTYNDLTLSAGQTYSLKAGGTQTINGTLTANGDCSADITINSLTAGTQALVRKSSGNVTLSYILLKDINAGGGATFVANNSEDAGDNTGWTIHTSAPKNLYWVGGTGNWSDGTHWSLTSGGAGSGCVPTPNDNVYFNANSFSSTVQTVTLDITAPYCHDMDWTGALYKPTLTGPSSYANSLSIYGSLTFISNMTYSYPNPVSFNATDTGHTVTTAGQNIPANTYFDGIGGEWTLQDNLNVTQSCCFSGEGRIEVDNGILNSNSKNINALALYGEAGGTLNLGSSTVTLSYGNGEAWGANPGFTLNAGTSSIICTGSGSYMQFYYYGFNVGPLTYYDVSFTGTNENVQVIGDAYFHTLTFYSDVQLSGSLTAGSMFFYDPGSTITVSAGDTESISGPGQLYIVGTPSYPIRIESNSTGTPYTFYKPAGNVCADYIRISDSYANGGATFDAGPHSQNLGGDTGWIFTGGAGGSLNVSITASTPDTICAGTSVTFTASTNAGGSPTYDWFVNGASQQNGASTSYTNNSLSNNAIITCIITNNSVCLAQTTDTSNSVRITVNQSVLAGTISALHGTICSGSVDTLVVTGNNAAVQWQSSEDNVNYSNLQGATGNNYFAQPTQATYYRLVAGTAGCSDTSNIIEVNINQAVLAGTISALHSAICAGTLDTITVTGNSTTVQWQSSADSISYNNLQGITGSTYFAQPSQGTYYRVVASSGGCSDTSNSVHVAINQNVSAGIISALHDTICSGIGDTLTVTGNNGTVQWQSSADNISYGNLQGATGSTYFAQPSQGTYYRVVAGSAGCSDTSNSIHIAVNQNVSAGVISATHNAVCAGYVDTLTVTGGTGLLQWQSSAANSAFNNIPGENSDNYFAQPSQSTYYRVVASSAGCSDTSSSLEVAVNPLPTPATPVAADTIICSGDSTQICITGSYSAYLWNTGGTTNCIEAGNAQGYWVTVTNTNGCSAPSAHAELSVYPVPTVSLFVHADTLSSYNAVSYQWYENGTPLTGDTSSIYIARQTANYSVQITDTNGCTGISNQVYVTVVGIKELDAQNELNIYPNPFGSVVFIENSNGTTHLTSVEIYDVLGRTIYTKQSDSQGSNPLMLDMNYLPNGIYYLRATLDNGVYYLKTLVKQ